MLVVEVDRSRRGPNRRVHDYRVVELRAQWQHRRREPWLEVGVRRLLLLIGELVLVDDRRAVGEQQVRSLAGRNVLRFQNAKFPTSSSITIVALPAGFLSPQNTTRNRPCVSARVGVTANNVSGVASAARTRATRDDTSAP